MTTNPKMDWLAVWGGYVVGFVFGEILEELATKALKKHTEVFFPLRGKQDKRLSDTLKTAFGQAIREFLQLVQQELEDAELDTEELKRYSQPLTSFLHHTPVLRELGKPFRRDSLEASRLANLWRDLQLAALPDSFDWRLLTKRYTRKVQALLSESDELRALLTSSSLARVKANVDPLVSVKTLSESDRLDQGLRQYRDGIEQTYGHLRLDSFDTSGYAYRLRLWNLFAPQDVREAVEMLPQAYELPKKELQRLRERGEAEERDVSQEELETIRQRYVEQPQVSVLNVVADAQTYPYIVILGDPGSGKSSLLQYLALNWAQSEQFATLTVPILVELRAYARMSATDNDFLDFIREGSNCPCPMERAHLETLLRDGRAAVMFDGLDEVFDPDKRAQVVTEILQFASRYARSRLVITSRVIGYKGERLRDAGFRHFVLQDFSEEQIQQFINRWHEFAYLPGVERERKRDRLKTALTNSPAIQQLAGNPLLLTMMAILNRNQELPRDRAELYTQSSRVLLQQWDLEKALGEADALAIDYKDKQAMLRRVAFHMQATETGLAGNLIRGDELQQILTDYLSELRIHDAAPAAMRVIDQLRLRNFILCFLGADYYAFVHRTFLEYFCAWEFVWRFEKERAIDLDFLKQNVFLAHYPDESWHEVLRLICGMVDSKFVGEIVEVLMALPVDRSKVEEFFGGLTKEAYIHLLLAADLLGEARNRNVIVGTSTKLLELLKQRLQTEDFGLFSDLPAAIVQAIATGFKDDPDTLSWLKTRAQSDEDGAVRWAAVQALAQGFKDDPDTLPWLKTRAQSDEDGAVRRVAVQALARGWKDDPDTLPWLKTRAQSDEDGAVRWAAVQALAQGFKDDPDTLPWLKTRAQSDEDGAVRWAAVQALAQGFKDDPGTLPILKTRAQSDENGDVRSAAVQALAQGFKDDPGTLPILKTRAQSDENGDVRSAAVEALAQGFKDDPDTLPWLKTRAQSDEDGAVRWAAVEALAQGFKDDPDTLPWLKTRAQSDEDGAVRWAAVQALAQGFKDDPDTLPILKTRAQSDENGDVRRVAVQALAQGFKDDPDTLPILKTRAQSDENGDVRRVAVQALAQGFKDDPDTLPILKTRAQSDENGAVRSAAVKALARGWKDDPDTLPILKTCDQSDENGAVRWAAMKALAQGFKDDPDTLPILKTRAQSDKDGAVRSAAVQTLARGWKDAPGMFEFLSERARHDPFEHQEEWQDNPRLTALRAIVSHYPDDPRVKALLSDRFEHDPDPSVRRFVNSVSKR